MNMLRLVNQRTWISPTQALEKLMQFSCRAIGSVTQDKRPKTALLMIYPGGPKCEEEIDCFVKRMLKDPTLSYGAKKKLKGWADPLEVVPKVQKKYAAIGNQTPQFAWIKAQSRLIQERLDIMCVSTAPHKAYVGCQFVKPSIFDALRRILATESVQNILVLPMYSQYSCGLTGGAFLAIYQFFRKNALPEQLKWGVVDNWATTYALVKNTALLIKKTLRTSDPSKTPYHLVFAAKPMPHIVYDVGDFYPYNVGATLMHTMRHVGMETAYSLGWHYGYALKPWLEPTVDQIIKELICRGHKHLLLAPLSSVTENFITYYEYDIYFKKCLIPKLGSDIKYVRVPAPNTAQMFITSVAQVCKEAMLEEKVIPYYLRHLCSFCQNGVCVKYKKWFARLLTQRKIIATPHRKIPA